MACKNSCGFQRMLEPPSIPTSKPALIKHAVDMQGIEIYISAWTYLKASRRIHGTLHTSPKQLPSVDDGHRLTATGQG